MKVIFLDTRNLRNEKFNFFFQNLNIRTRSEITEPELKIPEPDPKYRNIRMGTRTPTPSFLLCVFIVILRKVSINSILKNSIYKLLLCFITIKNNSKKFHIHNSSDHIIYLQLHQRRKHITSHVHPPAPDPHHRVIK